MRRFLTLTTVSILFTVAVQAQIQSVPAGGVWGDGATWVGGVIPGPSDHAIVNGIVRLSANASVASVTVESGATLQNAVNRDVTLVISGNVANHGIIQNSALNWWLVLRIGGAVTNNGVWTNYRTHLDGVVDQKMSHASGTMFASPLAVEKPSGRLVAISNLEFTSSISLGGVTLDMGAWTLAFRGSGYVVDGVITTSGNVAQTSGTRSAFERTRLIGTTTIRQKVNLGRDNIFEGTLIVADTLQSISGCDCTNYIEGDVINNGTIRDSAPNWWNYLRIHGDLTNNGVWTNHGTYLIGTGDQTVSQGIGTTFAGPIESLKETGTIRAGSNLDFSDILDLNGDPMAMDVHALTVRGRGYVVDGLILSQGDFIQMDALRSAVERTRFSGTITIRQTVNLGRDNVFEGTLIVADTLQNIPNCDCSATVEGHIINEGTIRNSQLNYWLFLNLKGSITNRGDEWSNRGNYLNGNGMRTWNAPGVTAPMVMNGGNIVLTGDNIMSKFDVTSESGPTVASGARFQVPKGGSDRLLNHGSVYVLEDVSAGGTIGLHLSDFRVAAAAFDSLEVTHHGNQAPYSFSNAVRSYWTVRRVPETATGAIEWMNFGYLDDQLGSNTEASLHVFHSDNDGQNWRQISSEGNTERHPESNYLRLHSVPSSGLFALSSNPDMITVLPSVITSVIGRDQIRLGPPNRYTIHYANNSDVPTGDMMMMLHVNRNIHIDHIEPSAPEGVTVDWLYPKDFAIYGDSTVAPPDTVAFLILQGMAPHEERSFDVVLSAYPDGYGKAIIVLPAISAFVWWAAAGLTTAYVTDMTFNVVEESFARTDGARQVISEAFHKTNAKWFSFEKPATELVKDLALTWGQGIIGGTLGTASVVALKVGEGLFNWFAAVACGGDRYVNGRQTISACIDKPVEKVTSWDPNEKIGPTGYGSGGYVTSAQRVTYQILFENKAEAQAPAWKIAIDDTLSSVFDVSTVRQEGASHDGFSFTVNGQALHWEITGIELPPNVLPPEGEGYVSFSVETVSGLPSGTMLENRAAIVFDFNPPIMTNTFVNTLDFRAPITTMEPLPAVVYGGELTVQWNVTDGDGESGVHSTNLFMSVDGGSFQSVGTTAPGSGATAMTIPVTPLHEYSFYALSKDQVGNAETVRPALTTVSVASSVATEPDQVPWKFSLGHAWPNPFNAMTSISYTLAETGQTHLVVFDAMGRRVATLVEGEQPPGTHAVRWDASSVASGVYFYRLTQGKHMESRPVVLLK